MLFAENFGSIYISGCCKNDSFQLQSYHEHHLCERDTFSTLFIEKVDMSIVFFAWKLQTRVGIRYVDEKILVQELSFSFQNHFFPGKIVSSLRLSIIDEFGAVCCRKYTMRHFFVVLKLPARGPILRCLPENLLPFPSFSFQNRLNPIYFFSTISFLHNKSFWTTLVWVTRHGIPYFWVQEPLARGENPCSSDFGS